MAKKRSISGIYSYKVRNRMTGLFRKGGSGDSERNWSKSGKTWTTFGALKSHLRQYAPDPIPPWWEIIVIAPIPNTSINAAVANNMTEIAVVDLAIEQYIASTAKDSS